MKAKKEVKTTRSTSSSTASKNSGPFEKPQQYVLTLRLPSEINEALERYIVKHSKKQRQKRNAIVYILGEFLREIGEL